MLLVSIAALRRYAHVSLVMKDLTVAAARKATARQLIGHVKVCVCVCFHPSSYIPGLYVQSEAK